MTFPSATWESKVKKSTRKGGSFTTFEKCVVMPCTGDPDIGGIPTSWKVIMSQVAPAEQIPYKVRINLITEMSKPSVNDQVPEVRDTHEASQDQAEEATDEKEQRRTEVTPLASTPFAFSSQDSEFDEETGQYASMCLSCPLCIPTKRDAHITPFEADSMYSLASHMEKVHALVVCPSTKGYTDQQMIAGRAIQSSFSLLNGERDDVGTHRERRLARSGPTLTAAIAPIKLTNVELDLSQQAELLPLTYVAQYEKLYVRPEHPTTAKAMTFEDQVANSLPFCSDVLNIWAMDLATGTPTSLTRMDPRCSPDLLFPLPNRSLPLYYVTPNDVKLLLRPNENRENADALMAAWEALVALFFAVAQIMRLCTEHEQITKSPFASYHQHALVSPDTLSLILPDKSQTREDEYHPSMTVHGLWPDHKQAQALAADWGNDIYACSVGKVATMAKMTYNCEYSTASADERYARLKRLDKTTSGLASTVTVAIPNMESIADWGVQP